MTRVNVSVVDGFQQMWLGAAEVRGQLCCPAAGHRVVLPSSEGFDLPGRCQEALTKCRGLLPAVLRTAAAEVAHDQGTNMHQPPEAAHALGPPADLITQLCCQGNTGREDVLFLRLYLLQSLLSYIEGNDFLAKQQLDKVCFCHFTFITASFVLPLN